MKINNVIFIVVNVVKFNELIWLSGMKISVVKIGVREFFVFFLIW